jgi:hypothetical protein
MEAKGFGLGVTTIAYEGHDDGDWLISTNGNFAKYR